MKPPQRANLRAKLPPTSPRAKHSRIQEERGAEEREGFRVPALSREKPTKSKPNGEKLFGGYRYREKQTMKVGIVSMFSIGVSQVSGLWL